MLEESHVDVLIVGAGPAGLMCANALAAAGVSVKIVDQRSEVSQRSPLHSLHINAGRQKS
jgi:2-polyprenyl-6-methoxyphenol hydroxylase-like FAD-dependent oxidoreductase